MQTEPTSKINNEKKDKALQSNLISTPQEITAHTDRIFWSDLTFKQQSSWIYRSAGTPVLLLSRKKYSEVALECLQSGKSGNFVT